jgi:hypothetical protein
MRPVRRTHGSGLPVEDRQAAWSANVDVSNGNETSTVTPRMPNSLNTLRALADVALSQASVIYAAIAVRQARRLQRPA